VCLIICLLYIFLCLSINKELNLEFIVLIFLMGYLYIKLYPKNKIKESYRQLEIFIPLINDLGIQKTLPKSNALDDYAANPDFLSLLNENIKKYSPKIILEAGSGISTLICGYSLRKTSEGKIFSLEHHKKYSSIVSKEINNHSLNNHAEVIYAPLVQYPDKNFQWYDISKIEKINEIDLLIIDGPPASSSKIARYPAIPLIINKLKKGSIIILDDANRKYEKQILSLWKKEYDCFEYNYINNSKGACFIKKIK